MNYRTIMGTAGILGAAGVGLGAFGAHGLREVLLERGMSSAWETAVRYHLLHAVALLAIGGWAKGQSTSTARRAGWAALCWIAGTLIFSGSLYGLALGGPRWLGPVTPIGGIALLAGWLCVVAVAVAKDEQSPHDSKRSI